MKIDENYKPMKIDEKSMKINENQRKSTKMNFTQGFSLKIYRAVASPRPSPQTRRARTTRTLRSSLSGKNRAGDGDDGRC